MVRIRIADHVTHASSYDDGQVIYDLIAPPIRSGQQVQISFDGFPAVPSAFINAALVRLAEVMPVGRVRELLQITDSTRYINDMIRSRFAYVEQHRPPHRAAA